MRQRIVGTNQSLGQRSVGAARALGHKVKRGVIRGIAISAMLVIYVAGSIGSMAPTALGVAGVSGLALTTTATPADAWRRRRRRRRWNRGAYYPYYYGGYRRRRRRRRGVHIYLRL